MCTNSSRIKYDRETLIQVKADVMTNDEIYKPVKLKFQKILTNNGVADVTGKQFPYPRRRYTSFNSDETGISEDAGEWIDAGPRNNSARGSARNFNTGFRGANRGGHVQRVRNWKNFDLEPVTDSTEENNDPGFKALYKKNSQPPGLLLTKWFYIDLESKERGPFPSPQMLEWFVSGFLSVNLKIRRSFDQYFRTIAYFFKCCNGSNPFEINTLDFVAPILSEEETNQNPLNLPPALGINSPLRSNNFWYYLSDASTLQGPFNGSKMQEWLVKKLIYPTLKIRRIDQQNFYELASLIKIVPDAFTNDNLSLIDLNSLLEASCIQENTVHKMPHHNVPNQDVQHSMDILQMSSSNTANIIKDQIFQILDKTNNIAQIESDMREVHIFDRKSANDQIGNAVENRSKFWYYMVNDKIQGPFSGKEMETWYKMNYFSDCLLVRKGDKLKFQPLKEYMSKYSNPFNEEKVFKFGDVVESQPIMKVSSPCSLCHNDECEFRGLEITSLPENVDINQFQIKNPCMRKPKFRCNHTDLTERVTTVNDIQRAHEVIIPTNPPIRLIRSFVKMRHCNEDDYEYTTISSIQSTIESPETNSLTGMLSNNNQIENINMVPEKTLSDVGPKQSHLKLRPNHNLNDSLLNNIQFVFSSPKPSSNNVEMMNSNEEFNVPPPGPPVQPQMTLGKNSSAWNGEGASRLVNKKSQNSSVENLEKHDQDKDQTAVSKSSSKKKKKNSPKQSPGEVSTEKNSNENIEISQMNREVNDSNLTSNASGQETKTKEKKNTNKQQAAQPTQNTKNKGKKNSEETTEKKKNKKESKQEAWDNHFQKKLSEQAQKLKDEQAAEREYEAELLKEENEKKILLLKAAKAKKAELMNELKEKEKMDIQLSQITLPKNVSWGSKPVNNQNEAPKLSFTQIQAQQAEEEARQRQTNSNQKLSEPKKSTWSNVLDKNNTNASKSKIEINFHDSQNKKSTGANTVVAKKPPSTVIQVKADIVKKDEKAVIKQKQSPVCIWNISDPKAIKKVAKTVKSKADPISVEKPVEPIELPELPSETNKKRQELINWCSKQMITLKQYTKIQSIDSDTMATLLCDLNDKDDVSKFVEECFGKSKVCEKFVKDFSQKKDRLLKV